MGAEDAWAGADAEVVGVALDADELLSAELDADELLSVELDNDELLGVVVVVVFGFVFVCIPLTTKYPSPAKQQSSAAFPLP